MDGSNATLYRNKFDVSVPIIGVIVENLSLLHSFIKYIKSNLFTRKGVKQVDTLNSLILKHKSKRERDLNNEVARVIWLDPSKFFFNLNDEPEHDIEYCNIKDFTWIETLINNYKSISEPFKDFKLIKTTMQLNYTNFTLKELLYCLLNNFNGDKIRQIAVEGLSKDYGEKHTDKILPVSFEQVGHIAHLNLLNEQLEYRYIIGQVFLDCYSNIKTVVNKTGKLASIYRNLPMEVIAGDSTNLVATVYAYNYKYTVPFDKVYWNSKLNEEHRRLVQLIVDNHFVSIYNDKNAKRKTFFIDVMAGVGPFSVPAAKAGLIVHANDLNPDAIKALNTNAIHNKVHIDSYTQDASDFINHMFYTISCEPPSKAHFIMNLPEKAVEFLKCFTSKPWLQLFLKRHNSNKNNTDYGDISTLPQVFVHCYVFTTSELSPSCDIMKQVQHNLWSDYSNGMNNSEYETLLALYEQQRTALNGYSSLDEYLTSIYIHIHSIYYVRNVAPKKWMYCIHFELK